MKGATPSQLWLDRVFSSDLSPTQRLICSYLKHLMYNTKLTAFPSVPTIAKSTGLGVRTVQDNLPKLIEKGWLSVEGTNTAGTRIYTGLTPAAAAPPARTAPPQQPHHPPAAAAPEVVTEVVKTLPISKKFVPPTVDEIKTYVDEKGFSVDPESFFDFNESKGWMIGKNKMKDWKAAVRTWNRRDNNEQVRQGGKPHTRRGPEVVNLTDLFNEGYVTRG